MSLKPTPTGVTEELFKSLGVDLSDTPEEKAAAQQKQTEQIKALAEREQAVRERAKTQMASNAQENAAAAVKAIGGIGVGIGDIITNIYNGAVTLADNFSQATSENPEAFQPTPKAVNPLAVGENGSPLDLGKGGDVTRAITNFAGPLVATMATGGGFLAGAGVNAAYSFLAIDPEQERLSDHLKGTFVEDVPIAASLVDYLQTKPTDGEMTSRWKNLAEGALLDTTLGLSLWGASRAYSGIKRLKSQNVLDEVATKVNKADEVLSAAEQAPATPVTAGEQAALDASDEAISLPRGQQAPPASDAAPRAPEGPTPEQVAAKANEDDFAVALKEEPTLFKGTNEEGLGSNGIDSDAFIEWAAEAVRTKPGRNPGGPIPDAFLGSEAAQATKEEVEQVLRWSRGDSFFMPGSKAANLINRIEALASERVAESLRRIDLSNINDDALLAYTREMENLEQLTAQADAIYSETGRTLRQGQQRAGDVTDVTQEVIPREVSELGADAAGTPTYQPTKDSMRPSKILAEVAGLSEEEALKVIGKQGRDEMRRAIYKKYGGREGMKDRVTKMKIIAEQKALEAYPDEAFRASIVQVKQLKSLGYSEADAWATIAMNGMLSSPSTWGKALIGNMLTAVKTIADNYVAAVTPGMDRTLKEANAHLMGSFIGLFEGFKPAYQALKSGGKGGSYRFQVSPSPLKNAEDVAENAAFSWTNTFGILTNNRGVTHKQASDVAVTALTANRAPQRVMVALDAYGQHVNRRGVIAAEAARAGVKSGLEGDALVSLVQAVKENPTPAMLQRAKTVGETNTFAKKLSGNYALAQNFISGLGDKYGLFKVLLPFTKTGFNVMEYSIQNSPLAYVLDSDVKQAFIQGGRAKDDAIAKVIGGTLPLMGLGVMASQGMIKGDDYTVKDFKSSKSFAGDVPKGAAIKIMGTDKWVEIPRGVTPLSTMVNTVALLSKASGYVNDDEYNGMWDVFRLAVANQMEVMGLAEQVSGVLAAADPNNRNPSEILTDLVASSLPMSGALRYTRNMVDPVRRDMTPDKNSPIGKFNEALQNRLKNIIPGMSNDLPPVVNLWGNEVALPDGIGPANMSPLSVSGEGDLEIKKTFEAMDHFYQINKDVIPGISRVPYDMPERTLTNPFARKLEYSLTPHEYHTFVKLSAGIDPNTGGRLDGNMTLREAVVDVLTTYDAIGKDPASIPPMKYIALTGQLNGLFLNYRERARIQMALPKYGSTTENMRAQAQKYQQSAMEVARGSQ